MAKLYLARTMRIDADRRQFFLESIISQRMTRSQAVFAWNWIIYGDWTFKGTNPTLELADFWPNEQSVEATTKRLRDQGLIVMTKDELRKSESRSYGRGHADGFKEGFEVGKSNGSNADALRAKLATKK